MLAKNIARFSTNTCLVASLSINQNLRQGLAAQNIQELKKFQNQALTESANGKNLFINSCTGSGKTLSYLLPILNQIMDEKQKGERPAQHGAVILTLNKELCLQIYSAIRVLDPKAHISVKRTGPITHYIPVVTQLSNSPKTSEEADFIDAKINANLVSSVNWEMTDILVSTPQLLSNILAMSRDRKRVILPKFIIIDEADLLLEIDRNLSNHTHRVLNQIYFKTRKEKLSSQQVFLATSSFPKKMGKVPSLEALNQLFPNLHPIQGEQRHQVPNNIDLSFVEAHKMEKPKISYLLDIVSQRSSQRIIIFCNNKKTADEICSAIKAAFDLDLQKYHASLDSNERSRVLHRFDMGSERILVSTDLASRGLHFDHPVDLIIEYEMAENITGFLNRVGRTGRNGLPGEVITFVEEKNLELFEHLREVVEAKEEMDELFSRKRSYRKLYKE